uniref:Tyrosine specific protein phosphatases domain-containing protein n=1 Tax=Rhizochromulina marina TaxID=1034831 RepID=A0A7S2W2M2_9STRA|mmetsp:Transcript_12337/g.35664  ORF Transcript_12337/g.35664 Transcript_12337/m.35664 type:complete len:248 (+) Transcript_12337:123-866(+)
MGAVFGVYLKYVGLSVVSGALAYSQITFPASGSPQVPLLAAGLLYVSLLNAVVAGMFKARRGMALIGKDRRTGQIPLWSYVVYSGFIVPTYCYTVLHTWLGKSKGVPVATEIRKGWWLGGRGGRELGKRWAGTVDLTVEFPEPCADQSLYYLSLPCWDGVPPTAEQLEEAAEFCAQHHPNGDIMIHCAHGRGRSTCTMCAAFVRAGFYDDWKGAFEAIKIERPVVRLNKAMKRALEDWTTKFQNAKR